MSAPDARRLVDEQAKDEALWFAAVNASEVYLQQALRALHAAVERETGGETGPFTPDARGEAPDLRQMVEEAADLICQASNGNWFMEGDKWAAAARAWKTRYHALLAATPPDSVRDTLEEP